MLEDTKEIVLTPEDEAEFHSQFPHLASQPPSFEDPVEYNAIQSNTKIIRKADAIIMDRVNDAPESLSTKDIIAIKSEAHKQLQAEKGIFNPEDTLRLIPATINIQINNH